MGEELRRRTQSRHRTVGSGSCAHLDRPGDEEEDGLLSSMVYTKVRSTKKGTAMSRLISLFQGAVIAALSAASLVQGLSASEIDPQSLRRPRATWNQAEREFGFANWDRIFRARTIARGKEVHALPDGAPLPTFSGGGEG